MDATEYLIGVKNTLAFIKANKVEVELYRPTVVKTEAGGKVKGEPTRIDPQWFRIVPMSGLVWDRAKTTPDEGSVPDVTEQLIGLPDADVKKDDYFAAPHGGWYKVVHVSPVTGYRKEARLQYTDNEPRA